MKMYLKSMENPDTAVQKPEGEGDIEVEAKQPVLGMIFKSF
jgi:hypothetical protein